MLLLVLVLTMMNIFYIRFDVEKEKKNKMSILKSVANATSLEVGTKYVDVKRHKVLVLVENYALIGMLKLHDVDDEDDEIYISYPEAKEVLRHFNLSTLDLRVLLCSSMIEFIELMLGENLKGGGQNGK